VNQHGKDESKTISAYLKYSGLAFQLAIMVALGLFLGNALDKYFDLMTPVFTIGLILIFFSAYMYKLYQELTKK
jgi:F0F1-type ATP synthase assembly protein I